jgi:hypothetical protein
MVFIDRGTVPDGRVAQVVSPIFARLGGDGTVAGACRF